MWYNVEVQGYATVEADSEDEARDKVEMGACGNTLELNAISVEPL